MVATAYVENNLCIGNEMHIKKFRGDGALDWHLSNGVGKNVGKKSVFCTCTSAVSLRGFKIKIPIIHM